MFAGIALALSELPVELIEQHGLQRRVCDRSGELEVQFLLHDAERVLPVWLNGQLRIVRWGNRRRQSRFLPLTAWTSLATVEAGGWGGPRAGAGGHPGDAGPRPRHLVSRPPRRSWRRGPRRARASHRLRPVRAIQPLLRRDDALAVDAGLDRPANLTCVPARFPVTSETPVTALCCRDDQPCSRT
jgi:hypothetical protein